MAAQTDTWPTESGPGKDNGRAVPLQGWLLPSGPYAHSDEHLYDELARIDQYVRAATLRWWQTIAADKPEQLWGMVHVTDAEVARFLGAPFMLPPELPDELENVLAAHWQAGDQLAAAIDRRLERTPPETRLTLRLERLCTLLNLDELERDLLLVCLLPELDARYRRLYGYLQDDASRTRPTVELALQILQPLLGSSEAARAAFAAGAPLVADRLIQLGGDEPLPMRSLQLDKRVADYLLGGDAVDERLIQLVSFPYPLEWDELIVEPDQLERLQALADWWAERSQSEETGAALLFHGPYGSGRLAAARSLCGAGAAPLMVVDVERAVRAPAGWEVSVELAYREALLRGAAIYWAGCDPLLAPEQPRQPWEQLLSAAAGFPGLSILAGETAWSAGGQQLPLPLLRLAFPMPAYRLRVRLWRALLPEPEEFAAPAPDREQLATTLANSFQLTEGQIGDAVAAARAQAIVRNPRRPLLTLDDLHEGCRRQTGQRLISMARLIEPRTELGFDDLILPAPNRRQLAELRGRIRHRNEIYSGLGFEHRLSLGKGMIALFTGSSGTGKTMAAELLAREQGVDLYKIDLSAVVSKYVGETEKNLSRVFGEAEDANAVLFFDEADALFGKRGEVKEARDRWANMEVNYLLQRVEEYTGVVILASNLRQNFDEAFLRRIHVIVEFPFPEAAARLRIWQGMFPPGLALADDVDLQILAEQFRFSGGSIKNVVVDAAFRALDEAAGGAPSISMRHLVLGVAREYQKLGKPITRGEFSPTFYVWVEQEILAA